GEHSLLTLGRPDTRGGSLELVAGARRRGRYQVAEAVRPTRGMPPWSEPPQPASKVVGRGCEDRKEDLGRTEYTHRVSDQITEKLQRSRSRGTYPYCAPALLRSWRLQGRLPRRDQSGR